MWTALSHIPDERVAIGVGVVLDHRLVAKIPIRQNVSPQQRSPFAFEFPVPAQPGVYDLAFFLMPLWKADLTDGATRFYADVLTIEPEPPLGGRDAR